MTNIILAAIVGIVLSSVVAVFIAKSRINKVKTESETHLKNTLDEREKQYQQMANAAEKSHQKIVEQMNTNLSSMKVDYERRFQEQKEDYAKNLTNLEARHKAQNEEIKKSLTESVIATTERVIDQRREQLEQKNGESMNQILTPLKDEISRMQKAFIESKDKNTENSNRFIGMLEEMQKRTDNIKTSADNLATALVSKGKVQGNWGEHVLADILRDSGLRDGHEFFQQKSFRGANNNTLIADVIVKTTDNASIIVDSKVSLTAYTDYVSAKDEQEQNEAAKQNYRSILNHIDELAKKEYQKYVDDSIDKVLMFVPNEGSYVLAINYDNSLSRYAYSKGIVLVNPTTLMLTLELIALTWQNTRQEDNCKAILDTACKAYDKLMTVVKTFNKVQTSLEKTRQDFNEGMGQLCTGTGNLKKRFEDLQEMGVTTTRISRPKANSTAEL